MIRGLLRRSFPLQHKKGFQIFLAMLDLAADALEPAPLGGKDAIHRKPEECHGQASPHASKQQAVIRRIEPILEEGEPEISRVKLRLVRFQPVGGKLVRPVQKSVQRVRPVRV